MTKFKTFFIDQHGCAKNQVDGELIVNRLLKMGLEFVSNPERADVIIINTCGFIESAKKESFDALFAARKSYPNAKILFCGCLAERYADDLKDALPEVDAIFGNGDISRIEEIIFALEKDSRPVNVYKQIGVCSGERKILFGYRGSAFVKVTEGCSNHCSFCAIPLIRGELRSRRASEIVLEVKSLIERGIVEINLIGQDLASYGRGKCDAVFEDEDCNSLNDRDSLSCKNGENSKKSALLRLLEMLCEIEGVFFIRLLYIHPDNFPRDILPFIKREKKVLPYFDIPFQSGDDAIIHAMNRKGTSESYQSLVCDIKRELPDAVLRTTFLLGFPGESEESFKNTETFLKNIKSDWSGCFAYSREEGTSSYSLKNRVAAKIAKNRVTLLSKIQQEITRNALKKWIGKSLAVLIEEIIEGDEGLAVGRAWFQAVDVDGSVVVRYEKDSEKERMAVKPGRFVRVKVISSSDVDLDAVFECDSDENPVRSSCDSGVSLAFATELDADIKE